MNVVLEMAAETVDPLAQHGDLNLRGASVGSVGLVGVDQLLLLGGIERHARRLAQTVQTTNLPSRGPYQADWLNQRKLARNQPSGSLAAGHSVAEATARIARRISRSS